MQPCLLPQGQVLQLTELILDQLSQTDRLQTNGRVRSPILEMVSISAPVFHPACDGQAFWQYLSDPGTHHASQHSRQPPSAQWMGFSARETRRQKA